MKVVRVLCGFAAIAALSVVAGAQARPDFSGRWVQVSPETSAGTEQVIKHEGDTLSTVHGSEGGDHGQVFKLDGSEQRSTLPSHGSEIVTVSRASWNGAALVITSTSTYPDGRVLKGKQTWTMGDDGRLTIDLEQSMDGQPSQMKLVFTKRP